MSDLFSPLGASMILIALLLDLFGLFCLALDLAGDSDLGESLSIIPDILGAILLGGFSFLGQKRRTRKILKKRGGKFLLTFLGELTPFLGGLPFWTIYVYSELK
jgi:hypothetical protein